MEYFKYLFLFINTVPLYASPLHSNENILLQLNQKQPENGEILDIYRLPDEVKPISYDLKMVPDLEKFTFSGRVEIKVHIQFTTNRITLHSKGLKIKSCRLIQVQEISSKFKLDEANELLVIETHQSLPYDTSYTLMIEFEGILNDDMKGFYRSSYTIDNKKYWLAVTQFETSSAREAFPCFDEPRFRTPFQISIAHFQDESAVSNMPVEPQTLIKDSTIGNRIWTKFQRTPPMATYLVAFMVSHFSHVSSTERKINVLTRPNAIRQASYALQQSTKLIKEMEGYIGISYKLPKLDVVAVPDFEMGAMENWGLTTYREQYVIMDDRQPTSELQKRRITQVIGHEFAHQWFGDLVTPAWWDYLWLNEGFARYFEYFLAAEVEPSWDLDKFFVVGQVQPTLWNEINTQRAMTTTVNQKQQLDGIFDVISYSKAASIIRMFEHMISPNAFRAALHSYLKKGANNYDGTVVPSYLFDAFEEQVSLNSLPLPPHVKISDIMKTWTENIGFPLVNVSRCYHHGEVTVKQVTYKSPRAEKPLSDQKWIIPLTYTTKSKLQFSDTKPTHWSFADRPLELPERFSNSEWILFNLQHTGYYRVNYDTRNWNLLIDQLRNDPEKIPALNRAQLIDDAFSLAYDDKLNYLIPFQLIQYLPKEKDIFPWITATYAMNNLIAKYEATLLSPLLNAILYNIIEKSFENFGFDIKETDSPAMKIGKPIFLELACKMNLKTCTTKALEECTKNENNLDKVQPDLKKVVFCTMLREVENKQRAFNQLWDLYKNPEIVNDKTTILESLACVQDSKTVRKILAKLVDSKNEEIRKQDTFYVYRSLFSEISLVNEAIQFMRDMVPSVPSLDEHGISAVESILKSIKKNTKTQEQMKMLEELEMEYRNLDQTKYGHLTSLILNAQVSGSMAMEENKRKAQLLVPVLTNILTPNNTPPANETIQTQPTPTSASTLIVSSCYLMIASIIFSYRSLIQCVL